MERILKALAGLKAGSPRTVELQIRGDHALMKLLKAGGVRAVARLVATLNGKGHRFEQVHPGCWREEIDGGTFQILVAANRQSRMAALRLFAPPRKLTAAELKRQAVHECFYDRYMAIGQKAYRDSSYRLSTMDRRLLLVGELEADVNNGGFSQYLDNKGKRRARAALAALRAIGAGKTAAMLEQALAPGASEALLARLDERFYKSPEDLAALGARHAGLAS